tara:strand:- start:208 stop:3417 length:3210 start_codon:yes stop_codon:yes gene_type:complete
MAISKIITSSLTDDAVTSAKIGTDQVGADALSSSAISGAVDIPANSVGESELSVDYTTVKPHIVPGVLQPAVAGKDLSGTALGVSYVYGTAHTDGHKYYYTDIKGSKPIKDPRIGAYFGSQRHKTKSIQILEQETAPNYSAGKNTYSIDGREWMRMVAKHNANLNYYNASGNFIEMQNANDFIEITGYFNDINVILLTYTTSRHFTWSLDGGGTTVVTSGRTNKNSPLHAVNRYVDAGSLYHLGLEATLGIHTLKIINNDASNAGQGFHLWGIDLIAQDRGSNSGSDLAPNNSATSIGSLTEANATAGWTNNNFNTFASVDISGDSTRPSSVGSYALHLVAGDASDWAGSASAITTVSGTRYKATIHYKVVNGDADTNCALYGGTSSGNGNIFGYNTSPDTNWHTKTFEFTATTTTFWFTFQEASGSGNDVSIYIAGVSLFALNNTELPYIQIPLQNVVSYGKKFSISATTTHYDPFTTMSYGGSGTTASALGSLIDTATSLGMDNWKAGTANYHRPWNGGRVVKWVDSTGTIKTSVTMMPPSAQNVSATVASAGNNGDTVTDAHVIAGTNDNIINFNNTTIANASQLYEVAKTFHFREFGNGSSNGNATYLDASTVNTSADIAYAMDDGTTSLIANNAAMQTGPVMGVDGNTDSESYITFIGTGIGYHAPSASGSYKSLDHDVVAQNLPYGTHIVRNGRNSGSTLNNVDVNGFEVLDDNSEIQGLEYIDIYQPKKPPIPEDAVVLSDYMLMADYVAQASGTAKFISKGVRRNNASRDLFYDTSASTLTFNQNVTHAGGFQIGVSGSQSANVFQGNLPAFATKIDSVGYGDRRQIYVDGGSAEAQTVNGTGADAVTKMTNAQALGLYTFKSKNKASSDGTISAIDVVTPIHTSHHYQTFETKFAHELIGGDRNMEQTNLVVSTDGKTWDQITRDVSYLGNAVMNAKFDTDIGAEWKTIIYDEMRGTTLDVGLFNKDFAIAYDRFICLKNGHYNITCTLRGTTSNGDSYARMYINASQVAVTSIDADTYGKPEMQFNLNADLKRGDFFYIQGYNIEGSSQDAHAFHVTRL